MADNVGYTPGSGAVVAADDVGGALHQRIKLTLGADGVSDGDVSSSNPMPVTAGALPLPTGAATSAAQTTGNVSLASIDAKLPATATRPLDNAAPGQPVRAIGQEVWNVSFADSGASVLSSDFIAPIVGTGVTYNQTASSLNVVAGTSTNAEFLTRSTIAWRGSMRLKFGIVASQRIANNNFAVLLADLIGAGLSYTINSATSVTVTVPGHTFTSQSVGQFINLGGITGAAGVPGRYAIASVVAGTSITFTVAGWPVSGSGTLTLFGHSYVRNLFTGVTATNVAWDAQRRGWATGDTTATINTTATPGTVIHNELTGRECFLMDQLRATSTTPTVATRASRVENIPDDNLDLYIWIWNFNGTVAPASSTTFTLGFVALEKFANFPVYIQGNRANGAINALPVSIQGAVDTEFAAAAALGDGVANPTTASVGSLASEFNGTTWDRQRGNTAVSVEASSAKTASGNSAAAITNHSARGAVLFINVTAVSGTTPTLAVRAQMQDPVGSGWVDIPGAVTASITTTGLVALAIYPGATVVANAAVSYPLPRTWRLAWTIGGTTPSFTFSVGAQYVK
jgi:hypothetical protein